MKPPRKKNNTHKHRQKDKKLLLSSTRHSHLRPKTALSSRASRDRIRTHHLLRKQVEAARKKDDGGGGGNVTTKNDSTGRSTTATSLAARELEARAAESLRNYQIASIHGQSAERGGDSSRVLVDWFREALEHSSSPLSLPSSTSPPASAPASAATAATACAPSSPRTPLPFRLLEVGALRVDNACSRAAGLFQVTRIDLNPQHPGIAQQDFMQRTPPRSPAELDAEGFDVLSLSLVLNFEADARRRGEMLDRAVQFLRTRSARTSSLSEPGEDPPRDDRVNENGGDDSALLRLPGLFLVLPAPCVQNSRYLDYDRLKGILNALGFRCNRKKQSSKLLYFYFVYDKRRRPSPRPRFGKTVLRTGARRNNFAILLER